MNTNYIDSLWENGYTLDEVTKVIKDSHANWQKKQENKKIEEARAALTVAAANYAEALGVNVSKESLDETINMLKNLENAKVEVNFGPGTEADKRLRKFLRGIM